jgi:hypothetical protein
MLALWRFGGNAGLVKSRFLSLVSGALVAGSSFLLACANGEPISGEDVAWEGRDDAGVAPAAGSGSAPRTDSGSTPTFDAGGGGGGGTVDSGGGGGGGTVDSGGGGGGGTCSPQYSTPNQACSDCSRSQCCSSMNAFFADPSYQNFATCLNGCGGGTSCVSNCKVQYPAIGSKFDAYYGCTQLSCSSACGTGGGGGGGGGGTCTPTQNLPSTFPAACNTCARTSCCSSMNTFYTSTQVLDYLDCLDLLGCDGTDPSCDLICMRAYPAGAAQADAFVSCIQSSCAAQCP